MDPAITDQQAEAERAATIRSPMEEMVKALEGLNGALDDLWSDPKQRRLILPGAHAEKIEGWQQASQAALARAKSTVGEPWRSQAVDDVLAECGRYLCNEVGPFADRQGPDFGRDHFVKITAFYLSEIERLDRLSASPSQEQPDE